MKRHRAVALFSMLPVITVSAIGCGDSPITAARIEAVVAPTFANLVHVQVEWMGLPPVTTAEVAANARCRRVTGPGAGSGEWACTLIWRGPDGRALRDGYDLFVMPDGCYTASVAGESLGGPALRTRDGRDVRNLLYAFDGCFDTAS